MLPKGSSIVVIVVLTILVSIHSGYMIGENADSMKEVESELQEVNSNYTETKQQKLTITDSEMDNLSTVDRIAYIVVVKPVYWWGRGVLDMSYQATRATAIWAYEAKQADTGFA